MPNKELFASAMPGQTATPADTKNNAGGLAYAQTAEHAITQLVMTGTYNDTFYTTGKAQLADVLDRLATIDSKYIAQLAIYAHEKGYMKDTPALLLAYLTTREDALPFMPRVFKAVVSNGKMLRNFVQVIRSGVLGRKSLGTMPKRLVADWLNAANDYKLLNATVGNDPSLADVIKLSRPKAETASRDAYYSWIIGKNKAPEDLPSIVRQYIDFKADPTGPVPENLPYLLTSSLSLNKEQHWQILQNCSWTNLRMNLNTFKRNYLLDDPNFVNYIAARLSNEAEVLSSKVFPYQIYTTIQTVQSLMPEQIVKALHMALQASLVNVPTITGQIVVCPDVSYSMRFPVTGRRDGATTVTSCIAVAALIASAFLAKNEQAMVLPFDNRVYDPATVSPHHTVAQNAGILSTIKGGGTSIEAPLGVLNHPANSEAVKDVRLVLLVSDNESWCRAAFALQHGHRDITPNHTTMMHYWREFKRRHPKAKLVCLDMAPNTTAQVPNEPDVLNLGGFSDETFDIIARFVKGELGGSHWVNEVKKVDLV